MDTSDLWDVHTGIKASQFVLIVLCIKIYRNLILSFLIQN